MSESNHCPHRISRRAGSLRRLVITATVLLAGAAAGLPFSSRAQSISLDPSFNPPLFTTSVQASRVLELANGQFLVFSGYADPFIGFDRVGGVATGDLVRYNADGTRDTAFQLDPALHSQSVTSVAPMSNGQYVIATDFVSENTIAADTDGLSKVYRLNADGSLDASFNPGTGTNGGSLLRDVAVQSDGKVIAGGTGVTSYNGVANTGLLRLNADGSVDTGFNVTLVNDPNSPHGMISFELGITTDTGIQVQSDDRILIAGGFNSVDGVTEPSVARLNSDGSLDGGFVPSGFSIQYYTTPGFPGTPESHVIRAIGIQSDGKIVLGGDFNPTSSSSAQPLVRVNTDGSIDSTFNAAALSFGTVFDLRIGADGKIVFSTTSNSYYRYNADGSEDAAFDANRPDLESPFGATINGIGIQTDGKVLLAGGAVTANNLPVAGVVRLNADGTLDTSLDITGLQADATPAHVAARSDGTVLASGVFDTAGGLARSGLALLNADGSLNGAVLSTAFAAGEVFGAPNFLLQPDGKVFLYGSTPLDANGDTGFTYLRLNADLSVDTTLTVDPSISQFYSALYQPGGGYLIGIGVFDVGAYAAANPSTDNTAFFLPRLTLQGAPDTTFKPGLDVSTILTRSGSQIATVAEGNDGPLAVQSDGKILYQYFTLASTYSLIRLNADGTLDTTFQAGTIAPTFAPTSGFSEPLTDANGNQYQAAIIISPPSGLTGVTPQADGRLLVYGSFTKYSGLTANGLARLNADGTPDATFNVGTGPQGVGANGGPPAAVTSVQEQADGDILVVGNFQTFNGAGPAGIAQLRSDGSLDTTFTGAGLTSVQPSIGSYGEGAGASQLAVEPDGSFLLTGNFVTASGAGSGSFFHLLAPDAGVVQLTAATANVGEAAGSVTLAVARNGGSAGTITVHYATGDGTAVAGTDYGAASGMLAWADGDLSQKTITVPIIDRGLSGGGTKTFTVALSAPTGGASLDTPSTETVNILDNDAAPPTPTPSPTVTPTPVPGVQPTIAITSPPDGITVTVGEDLPLSASVTDPAGLASQVRFSVGSALVDTVTTAPYVFDTIAPTAPGQYAIQATVVDTLGRASTVSVSVNVIAATGTLPPTAGLLTPVSGRDLTAGSTLTLSFAAAAAATTALDHVSLYADGAVVATFNASGNIVSAASVPSQPTRRDAAPLANLFQTPYTLPITDKLVNLVAVAFDKLGQSTVSKVATVHAKVTTDKAPVVAFGSLSSNAHLRVGSTNTFNVIASDPDAAVTTASTSPHRADASSDATLALLEYYLNGTKIGEATMPPFRFTFTPPATGKYILHAVATDGSGLAAVSEPAVVEADSAPTVNLAVGGTGAAVEGGANGIILVTRTGDTSLPLTVNYKTKGAAIAGVDFKALPGLVTIPAGAVKAKLKVKPLGGLTGAGTLKLKVQLVAPTDGSYVIGTSPIKIKLIGE